MKVVMFEVEDWARDRFGRLAGVGVHLVIEAAPLTALSARAHADAEAITTSFHCDLRPQVLDSFGRLKLLTVRHTGFDNVDLDYCRRRAITVTNVPSYATTNTSEHVFALLLGVYRRLVPAAARTRAGDFDNTALRGHDLRGKTIGIIGFGEIGRAVAVIAAGFGMRVVAFSPHIPAGVGTEEIAHVWFTGRPEEVLASSDVVTVHVPLNEHTRGLISTAEFALMRDGAVLINTARGPIVSETALLAALESGKLGGAGFDFDPGHPALLERDDLLVTPHIAYYTYEAEYRAIDGAIDDLLDFLTGTPQNIIR